MPNSYVMLGPLLGIAVILASVCHRRQLAGVLIVMIVCLTCDGWAHQWTDNWLKPIDCIIFTIMLLSASLRRLNINGDLAAPPVVPVVPV